MRGAWILSCFACIGHAAVQGGGTSSAVVVGLGYPNRIQATSLAMSSADSLCVSLLSGSGARASWRKMPQGCVLTMCVGS